jgi:hypothetical protein
MGQQYVSRPLERLVLDQTLPGWRSHLGSTDAVGPIQDDVWMASIIDAMKEYDQKFNEEAELARRIVLSGIAFITHPWRCRSPMPCSETTVRDVSGIYPAAACGSPPSISPAQSLLRQPLCLEEATCFCLASVGPSNRTVRFFSATTLNRRRRYRAVRAETLKRRQTEVLPRN